MRICCLFHTLEFDNAPGQHPFRDIKIAFAIPTQTVWRDELAVHPLIRRDAIGRPLAGVAAVADLRNEIVVFVENRHAPGQIANRHVAPANAQGRGQAKKIVFRAVQRFDVLER